MNRLLKRSRVLRTTLFLLMCGLSACAQTAPVEPVMNYNPLLADPRPWCIGRFVINRPARADLSSENYEYVGHKIEVIENIATGNFQHTIDTRESELRTKKRTSSIPYEEMLAKGLKSMIVETNTPWLEQSVSPAKNSRLLIYKEFANRPDSAFDGEGYVLAGSNMLSMKFTLGSSAIQKIIQRDSEWFRNVTYRDDWTVPAERGFCIKGALIGGPSLSSEVVEHYLALQPGRPSMFVVKMRNSLNADKDSSLLKNLQDLRQELSTQGYSHNVRIVREGRRQVAGMDAEEVLFSIKEGNLQLFRFYLMAPGVYHSMGQPHTEIQLILGTANNSTLTPDQATSPVDEAGAIQVWDTLLNSMRLRPGAM